MTKRLTDELNLPPMPEPETSGEIEQLPAEFETEITSVTEALEISERIDVALSEVRDMDGHDAEMDEIAQEAMEAFKQLMALGHNMADMAAGSVFTSATQMIKVALDARDSKVSRKLKQVDLMIKKENLDRRKAAAKDSDSDDNAPKATVLSHQDLMRLIRENSQN